MLGSASQGRAVDAPRPPARPRVVPVPPTSDPGGLGPGAEANESPAAPFGIVIARQPGAVLVTVHGELDRTRSEHLGTILADLIDGQGNLSLVVDLHGATTSDADSLWVFTDAAERARRRGGIVRLTEPAGPLGEALQLRGLDDFLGDA